MEAATDCFDDSGDESFARWSGGILGVAGQMAVSDQLLYAVQGRVHDSGTFRLTRQFKRQEIFVCLDSTSVVFGKVESKEELVDHLTIENDMMNHLSSSFIPYQWHNII